MTALNCKYRIYLHKFKRIITKPDHNRVKRVNFAITYRCNSKCRACSIWKAFHDNPTAVNHELSLDHIKEFFGTKYFDSIDEINLTGGEPFLRKDFLKLFKYLRRRFPKTSIIITTNGLQVKDGWIQSKKDICWTILIFSLDGLQKTNDYIRGIKGGYQSVIKAIKYYRESFPSLKMGLSFTLLPENYQELRDVYNISRKLNISFTMRFASESETYYGNKGMNIQWTDDILNQIEKDIKLIIKDMNSTRNILNRLLNPDHFFFSQMVNYQRNKRRIFHCYSGTHSLFIDPYGNIFPCIFEDQPLGNITRESFDDLWISTKAHQQRLSIDKCNCHCWTECETLPSLQRSLNHSKLLGSV